MARKVVNFVKQSQNGKYTLGDLRQLVEKSFNQEQKKGSYQIAEVSNAQYKQLEKGKTLTNKDFNFVDMDGAKQALATNDILLSENSALQDENANLQRIIAELQAEKHTTAKKTTAKKTTAKKADDSEETSDEK